ncbi:hypothetical protein F5882DRAFT_468649 [Hyaloscypha sp. PMI_1271]|nr:hypothetical protein F5882DRAFT_468649 [Hyaloscypha sp. PMI_1271]
MADLFNPDFLDDRVYQGLWKRHQGPSDSSRILTLSSYNALLVLASLAVLIQYCGARSWVVIRQAIYEGLRRRKKLPLRLPGSSPEPLRHLTPGRAIANTFSWAERLGRGWLRPQNEHPSSTGPSPSEYDPGQSPVLGTFALGNTLFFLLAGIALPYFLTEGTFGAPIVKSRPMPDCMNIDRGFSSVKNFIQYAATTQKVDSIFRECGESLNASCFRGYYLAPPNIEKRRLEYCPFPVDVCDNRSKPFEITHLNKTAFEAGINSPSDLRISHRTTCAPVVTEHFMLWQPRANRSWVSVRTTRDSTPRHRVINNNFVVPLRTMNGPNVVSDINSGLQSFRDNGRLDVTVLPGFRATILEGADPERWEYVHESLRREDGQSFMIVYTAGRSWYDREVDDPFFSAHTYDAEINNMNVSTKPIYLPDHEATTIACMDQFQMCFGPESRPWCSGWNNGSDVRWEILNMWKQNSLDDPGGRLQGSFMDVSTFVQSAVSTSTVHQSMAIRNHMQPQQVLLRDGFGTFRQMYGDEQWTLEVETWFMKAIVDSILRVRLYAKYDTTNLNSSLGLVYRKLYGDRILDEWPTCGRVLFQNSNYTNINWYGFCAVLGALFLICILSLIEERLVDVVFASLRTIRHPGGAAAAVKSTSIAITNKIPFLREVLGMPSRTRLFVIRLPAYLQPRSRRRPEPVRPENLPAALGSLGEGRDNIDLQNLRRGEDVDNPV